MRDLKWDAMLEQTLGLPQTESLLSFLPQVRPLADLGSTIDHPYDGEKFWGMKPIIWCRACRLAWARRTTDIAKLMR